MNYENINRENYACTYTRVRSIRRLFRPRCARAMEQTTRPATSLYARSLYRANEIEPSDIDRAIYSHLGGAIDIINRRFDTRALRTHARPSPLTIRDRRSSIISTGCNCIVNAKPPRHFRQKIARARDETIGRAGRERELHELV